MRRGELLPYVLVLALSLLLIGESADAETRKVAFLSSVEGPGDLGSWPQAGGFTGLAAGDEICRQLADSAGLENPQEFIAWLSDSSDDAYCRIHELAGKKSANCGRPTLPVGAGPWVGTNGYPFGNKIHNMLAPDGQVLTPIRFDETGTRVPAAGFLWTNTALTGELDPFFPTPCDDWTSSGTADRATLGWSEATTDSWTFAGFFSNCNKARPLLCMAAGAGAPLPPYWEQGAKIFVTATAFDGDLGGRSGAINACINRAGAANLAAWQSFRPWLSDESYDVGNNMATLDFPFVRIDGVKVADSGLDLLDGELIAPINVTQFGDYLGEKSVWTGSDSTGQHDSDRHCFYWGMDSSSFLGRTGRANLANTYWTEWSVWECDALRHLYCYSTVVVDVFYDGFESGDTSGWTSSVP